MEHVAVDLLFSCIFGLLLYTGIFYILPKLYKETEQKLNNLQKAFLEKTPSQYIVTKEKGKERWAIIRVEKEKEPVIVIEDIKLSDIVHISSSIIAWMELENRK